MSSSSTDKTRLYNRSGKLVFSNGNIIFGGEPDLGGEIDAHEFVAHLMRTNRLDGKRLTECLVKKSPNLYTTQPPLTRQKCACRLSNEEKVFGSGISADGRVWVVKGKEGELHFYYESPEGFKREGPCLDAGDALFAERTLLFASSEGLGGIFLGTGLRGCLGLNAEDISRSRLYLENGMRTVYLENYDFGLDAAKMERVLDVWREEREDAWIPKTEDYPAYNAQGKRYWNLSGEGDGSMLIEPAVSSFPILTQFPAHEVWYKTIYAVRVIHKEGKISIVYVAEEKNTAKVLKVWISFTKGMLAE